ncbi:MAG: uroporphyrinogen decarboxylase family protein, partial [Deltaproteobacteria bacterium]
FADAGFDVYHFEGQMGPKNVVKKVRGKISLAGCINNAQTLYQGTPEDAYAEAREAIEAGVDIIGPECAIPLTTPIDNLKAIISAVREGY